MKTHKNPNLRGSGAVPAGAIKSGSPKPAGPAKAAAPAKPPKLELEGKKWAVEYFKGLEFFRIFKFSNSLVIEFSVFLNFFETVQLFRIS